MALLLTVALSTMAMSYEQARDRALFLTDKMAYELNLNDEQYEAAYEVNLDYLMSISTYDDLYGTYWTRRNMDLSYILFDWQYDAFCSAAYFYRPLIWTDGVWRFSIYARYPNRTYFYFGRPAFYATYYGGHSWHRNGGRSWYHGRTFGPRPGDMTVAISADKEAMTADMTTDAMAAMTDATTTTADAMTATTDATTTTADAMTATTDVTTTTADAMTAATTDATTTAATEALHRGEAPATAQRI